MLDIINSEIKAHNESFNRIESLIPSIAEAAQLAINKIAHGGKIILFGNGGSAADAQHIAAELVGRYKHQRIGLPALALTTDSSALTSIGNDFGYEFIFERQIEALSNEHDLVIGISTSGNSLNVINGLVAAKKSNISTIGFSGCGGGKMNDICDINIISPSNDTPRIQEMHIFIGHTICNIIDLHFYQ